MIRDDHVDLSRQGLRRVAGFLSILLLLAAGLHAQVPPAPPDWTDLSPHEVRLVSVAPDVGLEVLDWGGTGIPLIFLAGASFNAHIYDDFAPRFTDRHRVIGITRRGHGASSWPDSRYDLPTLVQDIGTVLDTLGLERVILAGHSFGGEEITRFATEHPDRVAGLVYIDGGHDLSAIARLRLAELCPSGPEVLEAMGEAFENPEAFRRTQRLEDEAGTRPYVLGAALEQMFSGLAGPPDYSSIRVPALGVFYVPERLEEVYPGAEPPSDSCVSAMQRYVFGGIAAFAEGMQHATVVALQNSRHSLHLASPDELEAAMRLWLEEKPDDPAPETAGYSAPEELVEEVAASNLRQAAEESAPTCGSAAPTAVPYESRFLGAGGARLHYLDFGGEGLPLVLVHSEAWDACAYKDFGPRFTDRNRVLAITRPGYGQSEGVGLDVPSQGRSIVDFLDALDIERAAFAGNASTTAELTYLAEHHPERVAGLIYFSSMALPWLEEYASDPTRAFEMFMRANPGDARAAARMRARRAYQPEFLEAERPAIAAPALAFVARSGPMGQERGIGALALVGSPLMSEVRSEMPPSPVRDYLERLATDEAFRAEQIEQIQDPEARAYFRRLAADDALQAEVYRHHEKVIRPAVRAGQEKFRRAFQDLRLVRLDVSQVIGYEYRDAPELIEPHVRRFLDEVGGGGGRR
jgi:pimeloyl-ACP methyl ester carboxylesterase